MRLAVCLHLYYREQAEEFRRLLNNLRITGTLFDLFITGINLDKQDIDSFKNIADNTTFIPTDNRGYDIAPFIVFLHKINLDDYDYILKLHTKNQSLGNYTILNGNRMNNRLWGEVLRQALLGSPERIKHNFALLEQNVQIGMLGATACLTAELSATHANNTQLQKEAVRLFGREFPSFSFVAGTMFLVRAQLLKPFLIYREEDFMPTSDTVKEGTLAHIVERLFGMAITAQGYKIHGVFLPDKAIFFTLSAVARFLFQKKTTRHGKLLIKICKLPVWCSRGHV